jgi:hypothetical protein
MDTRTLRNVLTTAFNDEELRALCFDRFRKVYEQLATGMTKGQMIQLLLEHCSRRPAEMDALVERTRQERPDVLDMLETTQVTEEPARTPPPLLPSPSIHKTVAGQQHVFHDAEPIKIVRVITEAITHPRNDGTRGSALYQVPLQLSRPPSAEWAEAFVTVWDRPPQFSTMHRPGIAHVVGDRVILDGTTIEEVQRVHRDTLILVVNRVNELIAAAEQARHHREAANRQKQQDYERQVTDIADQIRFE